MFGIGYRASALKGLAVLVLGVGLAVVFSGGGRWSTDLYLAVAQHSLFELGEVLSTVALLGLVTMWAVTATVLLVRRSARRLITLIIGGCGAVGAYASSEVLKALFTNVRPCATYDAVTLAACSAAESWSYPSNHTVIGCALAASLIMAVPRLGLVTVPLAVLVGASRVLSGYHYPHDVLGGAALGASVVVAVVLMAAPLILSRLRKVKSLRFP